MSDTATLFAPLDDPDPATPGDPFSRLRYSYGQLLGAEDLAAEQRYHVLRERLLTATLHGHGTVWGLRVTAREDAVNNTVQLVCAPGLAVDALGRLIHVGQEVCLDVTGLALAPFWSDLAPPPAAPEEEPEPEEEPDEDPDEEPAEGTAPETRARRAYVVLSYRACLGDEVPAITPPCSDSGEATAYARVLDRWRLCLMAEPPPDPHPLARDGSVLPAGDDLRARLLDFILDPPAEVARFWSNGDEAPLLLATVDLEPVGDPAERTRLVAGPDNAVRALLPDVQTLAAIATGTRLVGPDASAPFALMDATAASDGTAVTVTARFTRPPQATSVTAESLRVLRFDPATGWTEPNAASQTITDDAVALVLDEDWTGPTTWQLMAVGAGAMPLLDADGNPLGGVAGGPRAAGGRDASLVLKFEP